VTYQIAEKVVIRNLLAAILGRIERLAIPPPFAHARLLGVGVTSRHEKIGLREKVCTTVAKSGQELERRILGVD
jgi:hypothetical protein